MNNEYLDLLKKANIDKTNFENCYLQGMKHKRMLIELLRPMQVCQEETVQVMKDLLKYDEDKTGIKLLDIISAYEDYNIN